MKEEDIRKGFRNLKKLQKKLTETKKKLNAYEAKEVAEVWERLGSTPKEARHVINIFIRNNPNAT